MSEQQTNSPASNGTDPTRAVEAKSNTTSETNPGDSQAHGASGPAASASLANDATSAGGSRDTTKPANIVLYSPVRANAKAERAGNAEASASGAQAKWANRKVSRFVAVAAIAAAIGSLSGALATLGVSHVLQRNTPAVATSDETGLIKAALLQLETQLAAMKVNVDHATKVSAKVGERLDGFGGRVEAMEKTEADSGQKIARIAEAQDKLRLAAASAVPPPAAPQTTAANIPMPQQPAARLPAGQVAQLPTQPETTGSIAGPAAEVKPKGDLKADYKTAEKAPVVDGWVLTSVGRRGNAIVASRGGYYEVYPGDPLPGVGRVRDIRYQDGRWVVVTPKGIIVRR